MPRYSSFVFFVWIFLSFSNCQTGSDQDNQVPNSQEIKVSWENISNFIADMPRFRVEFTMENNSDYTFKDHGWALYFNQSPRKLIEGSVTNHAIMENINGDFYRLSPDTGFLLNPGENITVSAEFEDWVIKETDAPLGIYFVFTDETGNELARVPVNNYTIKPFERLEQINRFRDDQTPIPTPEWKFENNENRSLLDEEKLYKIIPTPVAMLEGTATNTLDRSLMIQYEAGLEKEAEILASLLSKMMKTKPRIMQGERGAPNIINLKTSSFRINGISKETYQLVVEPEGISITGGDAAGVFYGIQSFIALLPADAFKEPASTLQMKSIAIRDAPAFGYRGLHLDLARNFQDKSTILKLIDILSFYKLNKLHLHLTDDEGWRLEIAELPELTSVGAFRGHTLDEKEYLAPAYGSGPFPDPSSSHGSGFLTRDDFKEIIKYAFERHIEVIPEINMPGHARAAIYAMKARYERLMNEGDQEAAEEYLLTDPGDRSTYLSAQFYDDNVVCVCKESVYRFYETVVDDLIEMYNEAQVPLNMIHTGGDEVPAGVWEGSPICQDFLREHPLINGAKNLQPYFFGRLVQILEQKGLAIGGWEEVVMKFQDDGTWTANEEFAGKKVVPYVWNSLEGNQDLGYRLANGGYPIILCNVNHYYFDLAYNKDPKEPGLYWGGFVNTRTAFEFIPYDLFKSESVNPMGIPFDENEDLGKLERLRPESRKNILGIQAELWSETVKGQDMLEYDYLPKLLGLAQRSWQGQADWGFIEDQDQRKEAIDQEWNVFVNTIAQNEFPRLDYIFGGYHYRIPVPGARIVNGNLQANLSYPGMTLRYTTDGTDPVENSIEYKQPVQVSGTVKLRAFDTRGRGGRTVTMEVR
jgi:hexosaminidase